MSLPCPHFSLDTLDSLTKLTLKEWDASIHLIVHFSESRRSILLLQHADQRFYDGDLKERSERKDYPHYIEIPIDDLIPYRSPDTEALTRRVNESFVSSSVFNFDPSKFRDKIPMVVDGINNEMAIKKLAMEERGITEDGSGLDLTFRFSREYKALFKMWIGFSVLIGNKETIQELTNSYVRGGEFGDAAYALVAVPLHWLLQSKERVLDKLREKTKDIFAEHNREVEKSKLRFDLIFKPLLDENQLFRIKCNPYDEDVYTMVSIYWHDWGNDRDTTYFMIPGGKRELGETTWECAVREMFEETGHDLRAFLEHPDARPNWTVTAHIHDYYFIVSSKLVKDYEDLLTQHPELTSTTPSVRNHRSVIYEKPCWFHFKDGVCPYGTGCFFRHTGVAPAPSWLNEENKPHQPCWHYFTRSGHCPYEKGCKFRHGGVRPNQEWLDRNCPKACGDFLKLGACRFDDECLFIHTEPPPTKKEFVPHKACRFYFGSGCSKGDLCTFRHTGPPPKGEDYVPLEACRFFFGSGCFKGDRCTFRHTGPAPRQTMERIQR